MWHDVETSTDFLNFSVVADTAAQLIRDADGQPLSIGVSGSWGVGKSSMVKMVEKSLRESDGEEKKYIFLDFNAWLYQGYDDARMALLQTVSDKLLEEAKLRRSVFEKTLDFAKRVKLLRLGKLLLPVAKGAIFGGALGGPIGALVGGVGGALQNGTVTRESVDTVEDASRELMPDIKGLLESDEIESPPKEIEALRTTFHAALKELEVTLVVFVDDLDRCLPPTAISTLEAMRLLLFMPRTAFIIAADEDMIRGAVRTHFGAENLNDNLVTSYFDKLVQVPLRVPRLGVNEVKAYLVLLFADLAERRGELDAEVRKAAQEGILEAIKKSWSGPLTTKMMNSAFGDDEKFSRKIDLVDQIAPLLTTANHIVGNPRLIKRFMNNLMIRESISKAQGMSIGFEEMVKLQLFERCASPAAFEFLIKAVGGSEDGKPTFFKDIEDALSKGEPFSAPDASWDGPFIAEWLNLSPKLSGTDLRPLLYLSKDGGISVGGLDELSQEGRELLDAILQAQSLMDHLVKQLPALGQTEGERILKRLIRRARTEQWEKLALTRCLHVTRAFPELGKLFVGLLQEIPARKRPASLIPSIKDEPWAKDILTRWKADTESPAPVKRALAAFTEA
jgi:predicted KAP-like P-loop ATPase